MNIESMRTRPYRSFKVDDADLPESARARLLAIRRFDVSRRTMFRWKAVMDLRRRHPFMGKAPIQRMLERKGRLLSVSTVGRIISRAIAVGHVPRAGPRPPHPQRVPCRSGGCLAQCQM